MTKWERQQVTEYYIKGYSIKEILLIMPLSCAEVKEVIATQKGQKRESKSNIKRAMILDDVKNGESDVNALAEKYNRSKATIYRLTRTGHKKPHYANTKTPLIVAELQKGDLSQAEIARKYNVSRQAVHKCKKYL